MTVTVPELRAIAEEVCTQRPDWELGAVLNVLLGVKEKGTTQVIRAAAMRAAAADTRAPVAITWPTFWMAKRQTTISHVPATPLPECSNCKTPTKRGKDFSRCPVCGEAWEPVAFRPDPLRDRAEAVPCPPHLRNHVKGALP